VVDRLTGRYPQIPRQEILAVVARHHQAFAGARVCSFVPVLVGRKAAAEPSHTAADPLRCGHAPTASWTPDQCVRPFWRPAQALVAAADVSPASAGACW
jgi:hypothetical protein